MKRFYLIITILFVGVSALWSQHANVIWNTPSRNSSESMPCGGGDIGMNIWVEDGDVMFYVSRSGTFDENNCQLKQGRVRLRLSPNPFKDAERRICRNRGGKHADTILGRCFSSDYTCRGNKCTTVAD